MSDTRLSNAVPLTSPLDEIEQPWRLTRAGLFGVLGLLALLGAWTSFAPLTGAVIGPGVVRIDMNRKTVQHRDGGTVNQILVRDGSRVEAGQPLLVLKDVRVEAENQQARSQLDAELAKAARLAAEQQGAPDIAFPPELLSRERDSRVAQLIVQERSFFRVRRAALANQLKLIESNIRETRSEVRARKAQLKADDATIVFQRQELDMNQSLTAQGFVSRTRLISLERNTAEYESKRAQNEAELARAQQKIADLELRAEQLRSGFHQDVSSELSRTTASVFELRERLRPAEDAGERQQIRAPIAGEVVNLKVTTPGAVIAPREPLLDIVPQDAFLLVETRVRPEDISYVQAGAAAEVRLTGLRQRITPSVPGTVKYVSADRVEERPGASAYYIVQVEISAAALEQAGRLRLQAGMPAEVFIQTQPRTALEYLLDPVLGFLQRSMREQ